MYSTKQTERAGVHASGRQGEALAESTPAATSATRSLTHGFCDDRRRELEHLTRRQLELIGEDADREGLQKTPARVARALARLTEGYRQTIWDVVGDALFEMPHSEMVLVRDIEMYSLCEHHLLPFVGRVHIAYIPRDKVIGLSKLPRLVELFARRLQLQERLTEQIASAVEEVLRPKGVGVLIEAEHLCVMMRGVEKQRTTTVTQARRGVFRDDPSVYGEFRRLVRS